MQRQCVQSVCRRQNRARAEFSEAGLNNNGQLPVRPIHDISDGVEQSSQHESSELAEENAEAIEPKVARAPILPSREIVEEHMVIHIQFRNWCPHCVRGKSKGNPHNRQNPAVRDVPTIVCDYMYMRESQGENEERGMPILVARDVVNGGNGTGMIFARVVLKKWGQSLCRQSVRQ